MSTIKARPSDRSHEKRGQASSDALLRPPQETTRKISLNPDIMGKPMNRGPDSKGSGQKTKKALFLIF
jgi:hypothetical protein